LRVRPQHLSIDGNRFRLYPDIPHTCIIKGDGKYMNIAAASVLAKTHRDEYMEYISNEYPLYEWHQNKGYPTTSHRTAAIEYGLTPYHRRTFTISDPQLNLFSETAG